MFVIDNYQYKMGNINCYTISIVLTSEKKLLLYLSKWFIWDDPKINFLAKDSIQDELCPGNSLFDSQDSESNTNKNDTCQM